MGEGSETDLMPRPKKDNSMSSKTSTTTKDEKAAPPKPDVTVTGQGIPTPTGVQHIKPKEEEG